MKITGVMLGSSVRVIVEDGDMKSFIDDGVIYLGDIPCAANTVEQLGYSELMTVCRLVDWIATAGRDVGGVPMQPTESDWLRVWNAARAAIAKAEATP